MALSQNAARALEQVKMGLFMLYGADYFTEDEWIQIDGLIHKGKYVLTNGPPHLLHEEELISFEESKDEPNNLQTHSTQSFQPSEKDVIVVSEKRIPSPSSSEGAGSHFNSDETPNITSAEPSSDEETAPPASVNAHAHDAPMFDFSEQTETPTEFPKPKPLPQAPTNGLPPGITQEQLDQAKLMQASMTKAGQKSRGKQRHEVSLAESRWADDFPPEEPIQETNSPAPSERDTRISSWASEVNAQQPSSPEIACSAASKPVDPKAIAEQEFIKTHGRNPKSENDYYQPKNPAHFSVRAMSRASNDTTRSVTTTTKTTAPKTAPKIALKLNPGSTYVAQGPQVINGLQFEVRKGDHIRVVKYVSGIMWLGRNLRTSQSGQFSEEIFKKTAATPKTQSAKPVQSATIGASVTPSIRNGLENMEGTNAAEWDEVPVGSRPTPAVAPAPVRPALGGLASSRFSVLAENEESKPQIHKNGITPAMKKEFGKMVDEKVDEILKARGMASTPAPVPTAPSRFRTLNETLKPVLPKKNTCWFWATNKGCRFTAEECRDLHGYLPTVTSEPTNLHMGRPTWGALADTSPTVGHADPDSFTVPQVELSDQKKRGLTCWYWARDGNCENSAEDCKYLHEHTPKGIAPRPWKKLPSWGPSWRRSRDGEDGETVNGDGTVSGWGEVEDDGERENSGELVLEEVSAEDSMSIAGWGVIGDGGAGGWGRDTPVQDSASASGWGPDDRYKPPHIKALEEKAMIEAVGW